MKKILKTTIQILTGIGAALTLMAGKALATSAAVQEGTEAAYVEGMPRDLMLVINRVSSTALGIVALIAIIMLIYGGIRYITSGGDSKKVTDAKNTILYAIIGLIISFLSYAIINFVIGTLTTNPIA